jgi:CHAT domain-containing protein
MKKRFVLLFLLILLLSVEAKAHQTGDQVDKSLSEQVLFRNKYAQSDSKSSKAKYLLEQSHQSYDSHDFLKSEVFARQALAELQSEYGAQPNFSIPSPGGVQETRFSIPFIFEFRNTYSIPSEVTRLVAETKVSFDNLFDEVVTRISKNLSKFKISNLQMKLLNRFGGCLYFGNSGRACQSGTPLLSFDGTDEKTQNQPFKIDSIEDLHSILKGSLILIQKSLIAQNDDEKAKEALVFAEMGRHTEFVRLAPLVLYGLLNYEAITSNPAYSKFFGAVSLSNMDLNLIRGIASREDATIVYYSVLNSGLKEELLIWVIQPSGNITFKKVDLSKSGISLESLVARGFTAAASFIDRGQQATALINEVRSLRSQDYKKERVSEKDFLIDKSAQVNRLQALYDILIKPVEKLLPTNPDSHVIFVPHKSLTVVPFAALQDSEGHYIIEKHTIRVAHSLSNLRNPVEPIRDMPDGDKFLAVGNPDSQKLNLTYADGSRLNLSKLPSADAEVENISPRDGYWFRRTAATRARILPWLKNAKIIHFATHGLLNFNNQKEFMLTQLLEKGKNQSFHIEQKRENISPDSDFVYRLWFDRVNSDKSWQVVRAKLNLPGAIVLADSVLTAEEILSLQLKADLVVLSACNSGRGVPTESGILGLPFALGLAGIPRVVVSQWSVPDAATRLLMIEYYNAMRENIRLNGTANPVGALRKAMLKIKSFEYYQDPIYWAGFITIDVSN